MSDLQPLSETAESGAPLCASQGSTANLDISTADLALMVQLHDEGKTQAQIAQRLGCTQQNVSYHLRQLGKPTRDLAERLMDAALLHDARRLNDIAEKGAAEDAIRAIKLKWQARSMVDNAKSQQTMNLQVVIGMPGQPAGPDPVVLVRGESPSPSAHNRQPERAEFLQVTEDKG